MLRRKTQLCRPTCSYCPVVKRLTKILEFLYCGYGTVINLSEDSYLENEAHVRLTGFTQT